jgi:hypothetical protein
VVEHHPTAQHLLPLLLLPQLPLHRHLACCYGCHQQQSPQPLLLQLLLKLLQ